MNISKEDLKFIKELPWWTVDRRTPYIAKGGVTNEEYYILISDMKNVWYRKADRHNILKEKAQFNSALQVNGVQGILEILGEPISAFDKQAEYTFTRMQRDEAILFELSTIITVYPFKWQFYCNRVEDDQFFEILTEDLVNPLLCALKTMETRIDMIKKQYNDLERDYMKKIN